MNAVEHFPLMIPGVAASDHSPVQVKAPFNGSLLATVATANAEAVEQALQNAAELFANRDGWLSVPERIAILEAAIELMQDQAEELAVEAAREGGKPLVDSNIEMVRCIDSIRICINTLRTEGNQSPPMGVNAASQQHLAMTCREPIGVVVALSAFNHPLNLIAHQVGPAIASGCPVIIKPAKDTPLSCARLVRIFHQAGLPQAWCQFILPKSHALAEALVTDERVAFFSFIGSAEVGWYLRSKLAAGTRCALEHGGVAPVIIADDADLDMALPGLVKGAFYHAGQVCVSVQRIYAHASIARELAQRMADSAQALIVGDPTAEETEVGPLIREQEMQRVKDWVDEAVAGGAELLCGGHVLEHQCYAPTVLFNSPADAKVSTGEVFGPVVCIYPFEEMDEAITAANGLDVAFQAAVYSCNIDTAMRTASRLAASAVMINEHTAFRVDWMPFAGLKQSGLGVGGIPHTMHDMQVNKMIVVRSAGIS
jgi:acyl-CoA reductase-like NAD-dependent aldehyde dehydrogenase